MFLISTQLFQEMRKQVLLTVHKVPVLHLGITPSCKTYKNATSIVQIYFKICFSLAAVIMKWNLKDGVPQAHWALCLVCGGRNVHMWQSDIFPRSPDVLPARARGALVWKHGRWAVTSEQAGPSAVWGQAGRGRVWGCDSTAQNQTSVSSKCLLKQT